MKVILASASPRRKELLALLGWEFEVMVSDVEEHVTSSEPALVVEELSRQKAKDIFDKVTGDVLVVGADTVVAHKNLILGKPKDETEAEKMLRLLSGDTHEVYTGVTLFKRVDGKETDVTFHECTRVSFYELSEEDIYWYLATDDDKCKEQSPKCQKPIDPVTGKMEWKDKAGAYGIQGYATRFVESICGDYNNVVGLPVARLYAESRNI